MVRYSYGSFELDGAQESLPSAGSRSAPASGCALDDWVESQNAGALTRAGLWLLPVVVVGYCTSQMSMRMWGTVLGPPIRALIPFDFAEHVQWRCPLPCPSR